MEVFNPASTITVISSVMWMTAIHYLSQTCSLLPSPLHTLPDKALTTTPDITLLRGWGCNGLSKNNAVIMQMWCLQWLSSSSEKRAVLPRSNLPPSLLARKGWDTAVQPHNFMEQRAKSATYLYDSLSYRQIKFTKDIIQHWIWPIIKLIGCK